MKNEDFFPVSHLDAKTSFDFSQPITRKSLSPSNNKWKNKKTRIIINRAVLCMFQIKIVRSCHFFHTRQLENLSHIDNVITGKSLKLGIDRTGYWEAKITALQLNYMRRCKLIHITRLWKNIIHKIHQLKSPMCNYYRKSYSVTCSFFFKWELDNFDFSQIKTTFI